MTLNRAISKEQSAPEDFILTHERTPRIENGCKCFLKSCASFSFLCQLSPFRDLNCLISECLRYARIYIPEEAHTCINVLSLENMVTRLQVEGPYVDGQ